MTWVLTITNLHFCCQSTNDGPGFVQVSKTLTQKSTRRGSTESARAICNDVIAASVATPYRSETGPGRGTRFTMRPAILSAWNLVGSFRANQFDTRRRAVKRTPWRDTHGQEVYYQKSSPDGYVACRTCTRPLRQPVGTADGRRTYQKGAPFSRQPLLPYQKDTPIRFYRTICHSHRPARRPNAFDMDILSGYTRGTWA